MTIEEIKTKANELKVEIENALRKFQAATGEMAIVRITDTSHQTNCGLYSYQSVDISIDLT